MPNPPATLYFTCPACGHGLNMATRLAGASGPCPACGTVIVAPSVQRDFSTTFAPQPAATQDEAIGFQPQSQTSTTPRTASSKERRTRPRARISADSNIDHTHLEQRETMRTLWMLFLFLVVGLVIFLTIWFVKSKI